MQKTLFTTHIVAVLWDFDKTLIPGCMQQALFERFGVDEEVFWREVKEKEVAQLEQIGKNLETPVFSRNINYLNHILDYIDEGRFKGLCNELLRSLGNQIKFYEGIPEIFTQLRELVEGKCEQGFQCKLENYVISSGLRQMIIGSKIADKLDGAWGCDFEEKEVGGKKVLRRISYSLDDTTKTRAVFEINKGVNIDGKISINGTLPEENRRVPIKQMIYVADGESDVPVFSVIKSGGGKGLVVYSENEYSEAYNFNQNMKRGDHIAKADYTRGSEACLWLENSVTEIVKNLKKHHSRNLEDNIN